ncbi:MAG: biopolymer transport protein ExbD [Phormidesmis priestleyi Ana]|uniref:Biopolymer transport protein ExbD n=1 Tax=Phormidesmis priestleyi Ana TaxID=1666911 RepID=A0A0P8BT91_9CYAN|nr:MAG: biopolymer transport protein ExbD [Phormidesmis priestleyi Ana]
MRSRRRPSSRIPEVNLVPMMDVLMTVLIFFVVISMGLTGVQINGVTLPRSVEGADENIIAKQDDAKPLVIGLNTDKELVLEGETTSLNALTPAIRAYFEENPEGSIMLKADRALPYEDIATLLNELRKIGGRRVSLAVE